MKKNILQFIGSFHQGGSERQAVQLAKLLKDDGEFEIFAATLNKSGVMLEEIKQAGFNEIQEYKLNSFFDLNFLKQLHKCRKFLRENRIDIVHTHDFYTNVFGILAARYAGVKVKIASKRETHGVRTKMQNRIEKIVFKLADAITVNSNAVKKYLVERNISKDKIKVIYNGLDLKRLKPQITDRKEICRILGLPRDENIKFITLVANLRHGVKNQPMLLRAAKRLKNEFPEAHYVFAGEGERKNFLKSMAKSLDVSDITHFIDRCTIVPELLSISYACVLTSYAEGFSNSILEYMSAARPVVATDVGGASEAIVDGETGYVVDSDDDETVAENLKKLLCNEELGKKMGNAGKKRIGEKFSTNIQLEEIEKIYEDFLA